MIINQGIYKNTIWAIGLIPQDISTIENDLSRDILNKIYTENKLSKRIKERIAATALLKEILQEEISIEHYENGKPFLKDKTCNISISHSKNYIAIALNKKNEIGIDIEYISEKINKVKNKFITDSEYIETENESIHLIIHWCTKEALFKCVNNPNVDFRNDFILSRFTPKKMGDIKVFYKNEQHTYDARYIIFNEIVLSLIETNH